MHLKICLISVLLILEVSSKSKYYDDDEGRPYEFGFVVDGQQHRHESKDVNGIIMGEFGFITADGVYHVTVYATDENGNFRILSMKNIKISPPLDQPGTGPVQIPAYSNSSVPRSQAQNPAPVRQQPLPSVATTTPETKPPRNIYDFTTAKPLPVRSCSSCSIPSTIAPIKATERQPLPNPGFENRFGQDGVPQRGVGGAAPGPYQGGSGPGAPQSGNTGQFGGGSRPAGSPGQFGGGFRPEGTPGQFGGGLRPDGSPGQPGSRPTTQNQEQPFQVQLPVSVPIQQNIPSSIPSQNLDENYNTLDSPKAQSPLAGVTVSNGMINIPGSSPIPIQDRYPGMQDGLPHGISKHDIEDLLYKFNYTVGFHGHHERGLKNGAKIGGYFVNGRDGYSRVVTYVADENGYRPKFKLIHLGLDSPDTPKEDTEKSFGLKGFEFVWYPVS